MIEDYEVVERFMNCAQPCGECLKFYQVDECPKKIAEKYANISNKFTALMVRIYKEHCHGDCTNCPIDCDSYFDIFLPE